MTIVAEIRGRNIDPTAGVTLVHRVICPRCGVDKGEPRHAREGLCTACSDPTTRKAWA